MEACAQCVSRVIAALFVILSSVANAIEPSGTPTGPIRFDAAIRLYPEVTSTHMLLFARYWVASDYYEFAVIWAEPAGPGLRFPVFPVSLGGGSSPDQFELRHDIFTVYNTNYSKPVIAPDSFHFMYGDYPITNLRFADSESYGERLFVSDFLSNHGLQRNMPEAQIIHLHGSERKAQEIGALNKNDLLTTLDLFDKSHQLLQSIRYTYEGARLDTETVTLPQRPIDLTLPGQGVRVKSGAGSEEYKKFSGLFEAGGRKCSVKYGMIALSEARVNLPLSVEVKNNSNGRVLRSAEFSNFRLTSMTQAAAKAAAAAYAVLTPDLRKGAELCKRQVSDSSTLNPNERAYARELRDRLNTPSEDDIIGGSLRTLAFLRQLDDMLGDEGDAQRVFLSYVSILERNGFHDMALWGGAEAIETEAAAGRLALANTLLSSWLDQEMQNPDIFSALCFARRGLTNSRNWETLKLLERLEGMNSLSIQVRFEIAGLKCLACAKLLENAAVSPKTASVGASPLQRWRLNEQDLRQILKENLSRAGSLYKLGREFTQAQESLHTELSKFSEMRQ